MAGLRTSAKPRIHAAPVQHAVEAGANGRLIQAFVNVFGTLVRGPGTRKNVEAAHKVVGRTVSARAGYHTLSQSARPRAGFGSIRPVAVPRSGHNLGLNSARNFSSSRTVFENVVNNAPLGLRVLGDKDRLDMRTFKRKMKAAYAKKRQQEAQQGKGKGKADISSAFIGVHALPSTFESYFPVTVQSDTAAARPSVQLVLPLNPVNEGTAFLSYTEDAEDSRFFSAMLMSDLRMLSDMHGNHHARLRNVIRKLETAGCFEPDFATGEMLVQAQLDRDRRSIVVTFFGERWTIQDVKQVLGLYEGHAKPWYVIIDLGDDHHILSDDSELPSSLPSDIGSLQSSPAASVYSYSEADDYERVASSLRVPALDSTMVPSAGPGDSYLWGVSDFLEGLDTSTRPSFVRS